MLRGKVAYTALMVLGVVVLAYMRHERRQGDGLPYWALGLALAFAGVLIAVGVLRARKRHDRRTDQP